MTIRKAIANDIPQIVPLWRELTDEHEKMTPIFLTVDGAAEKFGEYVASLLPKENCCVLVCEDEGEIVGYIIASSSILPDVFQMRVKVYIQDMFVKKTFRRKGVGKKLVSAVRTFATEQKADWLNLLVAVQNESGYEFWKKMGFETTMHGMSIVNP